MRLRVLSCDMGGSGLEGRGLRMGGIGRAGRGGGGLEGEGYIKEGRGGK